MQEPLVSICCLAYNHEPYIRECLDGFMMQKTDFSFEVLIHDDASTDNTADIIREYEAKYPGIIKPIYQTENQYSKRVGVTRTFQFPRAKGKYIAMCEGDDYWIDPLKLQKQVDFLETNPEYTMHCHNATKIFDIERVPELFNKRLSSGELLLRDIITEWIIPTASIMFKKEILPLPIWANQVYSGDMTLALLAVSKGKIYYSSEVMSVYRINLLNKTSMTSQLKGKTEFMLEEHLKLYTLYLNDQSLCVDKKVVEIKIKSLNKVLKFYKIWSENKLLAFIKMPIFYLKSIIDSRLKR